MANQKNTNTYAVTSKVTVPASANGTGTIVTDGKAIKGTGTKFKTLSELRRGCFIVSIGADEMREVKEVESDTFARLGEAFLVDLTSAAPLIIDSTDLNIKAISVGIISGLTDGEIDGKVFVNNTSYTFEKNGNNRRGDRDYIDPIIIDGTSTSIDVIILK